MTQISLMFPMKGIFSFFPPARIVSILVFVFFLSGSLHAGDMYKWTDEKGNVHLTDNPAELPEQFRENVERKKIPTPNQNRIQIESRYGSLTKEIDQKEYRIPLIQRGYNYLVEVKINNRVTAHLVVDTGASLNAVSEEVAKKLGYVDYSKIPKYPFRTAGGIIWDPLVTLDGMNIGGAFVENVEASILSKIIGVDGLLGMSFLQEFDFKLDVVNGVLILAPYPDSAEGTYGNRPQRWWVQKYSYYVSNIRNFENLKRQIEKGGESYYQTSEIDHYQNVSRILKYYRSSLDRLNRLASSVAVPINWRKRP